ncbi:MAG: ANTAR domain-containing protein [Alistipes sp.]|nr:ANTAR domain-containing protein [Alistipes sp.]
MVTSNIIVAFPKIEDARKIKSILSRNGFNVVAACSSGAFAISTADHLDNGIVVCGYRLSDIVCMELRECLPKHFKVVMAASETHWEEVRDLDIVFVPLPLKMQALTETLHMIEETQLYRRRNRNDKPKERDKKELELIETAKRLLIDKNNMTEEEAHKYIQKCSMDSGNSMVETAGMVISIYGG